MSYATEVARTEQKTKSIVKQMEIGSFKASLMKARRLTGEAVHGLPPGQPVDVFPIAALPGCPEAWVKAAGSYVCPVDANWGLWFDWTMNDSYNTAIIPSVKGMNPITGLKIEHIGMEQYRDKCPVHGIDFSHDRYCEKCDYKWPPQNYVCYPDTLWWDGFRSSDGNVRQFFFTEEEKRDIASLVIGKENTVPAFGFVFYQTKNPRNITPPATGRGIMIGSGLPYAKKMLWGPGGSSAMGKPMSDVFYKASISHDAHPGAVASSAAYSADDSDDDCEIGSMVEGEHFTCGGIELPEKAPTPKKSVLRSQSVKDVSVGGGARIAQKLSADPLALDAWTDKESGLIRLYFVFENQFRQIVEKGGIKDVSGTEEGYLSGLPIG